MIQLSAQKTTQVLVDEIVKAVLCGVGSKMLAEQSAAFICFCRTRDGE